VTAGPDVDSAFPRSDPPYAAGDATMLRAFLDFYRATLLRQGEGLTEEQLAARLGPSTLTIGGLVKHMTIVESWWFREVLFKLPELAWVPDGAFDDDPDWEFHSARDDPWDLLVERFRAVVAEADELLDRALATPAALDLEALRPRRDGSIATLRWILVHLVEEYARHAGHADLIRESIDGATDI
jgi:hypothetical protein